MNNYNTADKNIPIQEGGEWDPENDAIELQDSGGDGGKDEGTGDTDTPVFGVDDINLQSPSAKEIEATGIAADDFHGLVQTIAQNSSKFDATVNLDLMAQGTAVSTFFDSLGGAREKGQGGELYCICAREDRPNGPLHLQCPGQHV